jgi:proline dehydrogenase
MLRASFLFLSRVRWAQSLISRLPPARAMAARFVAGDSLDQAMAVCRALNARGLNVSVDFLGESVTRTEEATRCADEYWRALEQIEASGVRANVSLKLTQMGLDLDPALCLQNVRRIAERARAAATFVRVDMEDAAHTDRTLAVVRQLRRDFDNVGVVLQAYLYRTEQDLKELTAEDTRVRLCKGAYQEPPDQAFPRKADVDGAYIRLSQQMLDHAAVGPAAGGSGRVPPFCALATHDERMVAAARAYAAEHGISAEAFEFQMLYGIRSQLQERLAREGCAVRVYVPYGTHWYPYFMRRLAERPANLWFFVSSLFRR